MEATSSEDSSPLIHCEVIQALDNRGSLNVLVLCMDQPGSEHNIIDRRFALELANAVHGAREKVEAGEVDVVVVCSAKRGSFMAGADIVTEVKFIGIQGQLDAYSDVSKLQAVFCQLESLSVPTIAILNGTTLGGGLELALSCDFRIADSALCQQIGLPEVKIGVLPGAGGCVRLPRLIGLQPALSLLVSGQSISGTRAKKLGLVDHLLSNTQSVRQSSSSRESGEAIYDYQWLDEVLNFLENRRIGSQTVEVERRDVTVAVSARMSGGGAGGVANRKVISEEEIIQYMTDWEVCEEKAKQKYPKKSTKLFHRAFDFIFSALLYCVVLAQLLWKVGLKMQAPYACLQTTFRCYYAGSWLEAMTLNSLGMANLIISPESKSLMTLFLTTRSLKKSAVNFGLRPPEKGLPFSEHNCSVLVLATEKLKSHWSAFVQGLVYNGIAVSVLVPDGSARVLKVQDAVRKLCNYALKRKRATKADVDKAMQLLSCYEVSQVDHCLEERCAGGKRALVINCAGNFPGYDTVTRAVDGHFSEIVRVGVSPFTAHQQQSVWLNLGDPLRNNTMVVEVAPASTQTDPVDVRLTSSLISAIKKTPVVTPPTLPHSAGVSVLISHWSLAVSLYYLYKGSISPSSIDRALVAAGYLRGPFQAMKKVGKSIAPLLSESSVTQARLKTYLETGALPSYRTRRLIQVTKQTIADMFAINLVLACLQARKQSLAALSEYALDLLCVGGQVGFPPTESGPLNYSVRLGRSKLVEMTETFTKQFPIIVETCGLRKPLALLTEQNFAELFSKIESQADQDESPARIFQDLRSDVQLLERKELEKVPCCKGVRNSEVFWLPACIAFTMTVFTTALVLLAGLLLS